MRFSVSFKASLLLVSLIFIFMFSGCGKKNGEHTTYYGTGEIEEKAYFSDGVQQGKSTVYHKNGKIKEERN